MKKFCEWQMKAAEDKGKGTWTCTAHLAEAHVFQCRRTSMEDAKKEPYPCEDATPVEKKKKKEPPLAKTKAARRVVPNIEVANCGFDGKIMPPNSIVIAEVGNGPDSCLMTDYTYPWKKGDSLLYLGEIVNMPGHCSVVTRKGEVHWGYHTENFRLATEEEV